MKTKTWAFEGSLSLLFPKVLEQCECGRGFRGLGAAVPQGCHCQWWERHLEEQMDSWSAKDEDGKHFSSLIPNSIHSL